VWAESSRALFTTLRRGQPTSVTGAANLDQLVVRFNRTLLSLCRRALPRI